MAVVICGAGIAGVSTAYHLAVRQRVDDVIICDPAVPLGLTSDKSSECYRNWWPGPGTGMVDLMNRSIDLMEEIESRSGGALAMNRRGYLYVTGDPAVLHRMERSGREIAALGAGELRVHHDTVDYSPAAPSGVAGPGGADLLVGDAATSLFPYLGADTVGALHARRAGWLSAHQLGSRLLDEARAAGARLVGASVVGIDSTGGRVRSVRLDDGSVIPATAVINAAGPMQKDVAAMVDMDLPVFAEVHNKVAFRDSRAALPRGAPMLIWMDAQVLDWSPDEVEMLRSEGRGPLTGTMPPICHCRPEGGADSPWVVALWEYHKTVMDPVWPIPEDPLLSEVVVRGISRMVPAMAAYRDHLPQPFVDGGYYVKTTENRPLIGPIGPEGSFLVGALSGFGIMAAPAAGELAAAHVLGLPLPAYAPEFELTRYEDPAYIATIATQEDTGQL
jgi:glycine/D-amino acid oxidase-like deaminating enzyme